MPQEVHRSTAYACVRGVFVSVPECSSHITNRCGWLGWWGLCTEGRTMFLSGESEQKINVPAYLDTCMLAHASALDTT